MNGKLGVSYFPVTAVVTHVQSFKMKMGYSHDGHNVAQRKFPFSFYAYTLNRILAGRMATDVMIARHSNALSVGLKGEDHNNNKTDTQIHNTTNK
jgi:hypothetical protein